MLISLAWQAVLFRPGVFITEEAVRVQNLFSYTTFPISDVDSFELLRKTEPNDLLTRSVYLVLKLRHEMNGPERKIDWITWLDFVSPWFNDRARPYTTSQLRILNKLNAALKQSAHYL